MFVEITDIAMNQPCKTCGRLTNNLVAENLKIVKSSNISYIFNVCAKIVNLVGMKTLRR